MHDPREHALVCKALRDGLGGCVEWDEAGLVKSWSCKSCAFIPISLRPFPPLANSDFSGVIDLTSLKAAPLKQAQYTNAV